MTAAGCGAREGVYLLRNVAFCRRASRESISWNITRFQAGLLDMKSTLGMLTANEENSKGGGSVRDERLNQVRDSSFFVH